MRRDDRNRRARLEAIMRRHDDRVARTLFELHRDDWPFTTVDEAYEFVRATRSPFTDRQLQIAVQAVGRRTA